MASLCATVIVPTYGEAPYLTDLVAAIGRQSLLDHELLIVDNNEHPRHRLADLSGHRNVRVLHEPRNGLQHARNAGANTARGTYVAFLDDDAIPAADWLECLIAGAERYQASAVGGRVVLSSTSAWPPWLRPELRAMLSELSYQEQDIPTLLDDQYVVGANFCVARRVFDVHGLFDPSFDRTASTLMSSGELEFTRRLQVAGERVSFIASATVAHIIPRRRLSRRYFAARMYWQGRSDALLERKWGRPKRFGRRGGLATITALGRAVAAVAAATNQDDRFVAALGVYREWGYAIQATSLAAQACGLTRTFGLGRAT
jgi:GT2 family glycosyltransferase